MRWVVTLSRTSRAFTCSRPQVSKLVRLVSPSHLDLSTRSLINTETCDKYRELFASVYRSSEFELSRTLRAAVRVRLITPPGHVISYYHTTFGGGSPYSKTRLNGLIGIERNA